MSNDQTEFQIGDTFAINTWGRLTATDIARRGVDILAGIVRNHHADCPSPYHFWCAPPQVQVFAMAELYQATGKQGEHYIGCYLRGADFDASGVPTIHESPSIKMIMQLLDDGRVFVHFGPLSVSGSGDSGPGFGLLDQQAAERFMLTPWPVPNVPEAPGEPITFVFQRYGGNWYIAHFAHDGVLPESTQLKVFATLSVSANSAQLTQIEIDNFPA